MPRFKTPDYGLKMIPVDFAQQVLPGTFEFVFCHLVDNELDLATPNPERGSIVNAATNPESILGLVA